MRAQSCDTVDRSLPGSSVHGLFQARILEWVALSFSINLKFKWTKVKENLKSCHLESARQPHVAGTTTWAAGIQDGDSAWSWGQQHQRHQGGYYKCVWDLPQRQWYRTCTLAQSPDQSQSTLVWEALLKGLSQNSWFGFQDPCLSFSTLISPSLKLYPPASPTPSSLTTHQVFRGNSRHWSNTLITVL